MTPTKLSKQRLKEIRNCGCLVPRDPSKDAFLISSHEKTHCDCVIRELLEHIEAQDKEIERLKGALIATPGELHRVAIRITQMGFGPKELES